MKTETHFAKRTPRKVNTVECKIELSQYVAWSDPYDGYCSALSTFVKVSIEQCTDEEHAPILKITMTAEEAQDFALDLLNQAQAVKDSGRKTKP